MKFYAVTPKGDRIKLDNLISLNINIEEKVPADDLTAVFGADITDELAKIEIYKNEKLFFCGIVDEQINVYPNGYIYTKISARSMAALLIDNEAMPQVYVNPNALTVFLRQVKSVGINEYVCEKKPFAGRITISKGQSRWDAVDSFCRSCLGTIPEVSADGKLLMCGYVPDKTLFFGENGIRVSYAHICRKRHKLISDVFVKTSSAGDYTVAIKNETAQANGVMRQRYLNISQTAGAGLDVGKNIIKEGNRECFTAAINVPGFFADVIGQKAVFEQRGKRYENLFVSKVRYTYDRGEEKTALLLKNRI